MEKSTAPKSSTAKKLVAPIQINKRSEALAKMELLAANANSSTSAAIRTAASSAAKVNEVSIAALSPRVNRASIVVPKMRRTITTVAKVNKQAPKGS